MAIFERGYVQLVSFQIGLAKCFRNTCMCGDFPIGYDTRVKGMCDLLNDIGFYSVIQLGFVSNQSNDTRV